VIMPLTLAKHVRSGRVASTKPMRRHIDGSRKTVPPTSNNGDHRERYIYEACPLWSYQAISASPGRRDLQLYTCEDSCASGAGPQRSRSSISSAALWS
jgi:hypothetical protein